MPHTRVEKSMRQKARGLRHAMTKSEWLLWKELRDLKDHGYRFRRQAPIGRYVVDFVCLAAKLVIEVDGDSHETLRGKQHDAVRDRYLQGLGYRTLRISSSDVCANPWQCAQEVRAEIETYGRKPHPSVR